MGEALLVSGVAALDKTIHVELSHEGGKVVVFKVLREDFFCEFI